MPLTIPYFENKKEFLFTDSAGHKKAVASFGLREEDRDACFKLRAQFRPLYCRKKIIGAIPSSSPLISVVTPSRIRLFLPAFPARTISRQWWRMLQAKVRTIQHLKDALAPDAQVHSPA